MRRGGTVFALGALVAGLVLVVPGAASGGPTYYVDAVNGDDGFSEADAQNPSTPWRTIRRAVDAGALASATGGYTVVVQPGLYEESVESKRDGSPDAPIVIRAAIPGTVTVRPPTGATGVFVSHHHHVIEGLVVTAGTVGLRLGPHDGGDGPVVGVVARNNVVHANSSNGIQFSNAVGGVAQGNTVYGNGRNGILYSGNGSRLQSNVVTGNAQFGIYVRDGVDHVVCENSVYDNAAGNVKIAGSETLLSPCPSRRVFYVDGAAGDDGYDEVQAQSPSTPWRTPRRALQAARPGDTVGLLPGVYQTNVESVRDGAADAPITLRAVQPGTVVIAPASGSAVYVGHHHHVIEGLVVSGPAAGLQFGPYKNTGGPVFGSVARENLVRDNSGAGIRFVNVVDGTAAHNVVRGNGREGIVYTGSGATIFNNLVYGNGWKLTGQYAITLTSGDRHLVMSNTVYGNYNGGIRLATSNSVPVFSTVLNNVVVGNPIGIREPAGSDYAGYAQLAYNNVFGNSEANYALSRSVPGPGSISVEPGFVDPTAGDFRLGRRATGQASDSLLIDRGSDTAEAVGLGRRTAFVDKRPDTGPVDLGYHPTTLHLAEGVLDLSQATLTLDPAGDSVTVRGTLRPGAGGDGFNPGAEYVEVEFAGLRLVFDVVGARQTGAGWTYEAAGGAWQASLQPLADGSLSLSVDARGLSLGPALSTAVAIRVGDDFASAGPRLRGTLSFP